MKKYRVLIFIGFLDRSIKGILGYLINIIIFIKFRTKYLINCKKITFKKGKKMPLYSNIIKIRIKLPISNIASDKTAFSIKYCQC